jgi:hypothetical protein
MNSSAHRLVITELWAKGHGASAQAQAKHANACSTAFIEHVDRFFLGIVLNM